MGRSKGSRLKGWIESPNALRWRLDQYEAARLRRGCPVGTGPFLICDPERARNVRRQYTQELFCVYLAAHKSRPIPTEGATRCK
jgi:hypothetical protein